MPAAARRALRLTPSLPFGVIDLAVLIRGGITNNNGGGGHADDAEMDGSS